MFNMVMYSLFLKKHYYMTSVGIDNIYVIVQCVLFTTQMSRYSSIVKGNRSKFKGNGT